VPNLQVEPIYVEEDEDVRVAVHHGINTKYKLADFDVDELVFAFRGMTKATARSPAAPIWEQAQVKTVDKRSKRFEGDDYNVAGYHPSECKPLNYISDDDFDMVD